MLVGSLMLIVGVVSCVAGGGMASQGAGGIGALGIGSLLGTIGFVLAVAGRMGAWYSRG